MSTPAFITLTSGEATVLGYKQKKKAAYMHTWWCCVATNRVHDKTKQNKKERDDWKSLHIYMVYIYMR
jgi:hypothetical protein